jgi:hypothetical protein
MRAVGFGVSSNVSRVCRLAADRMPTDTKSTPRKWFFIEKGRV